MVATILRSKSDHSLVPAVYKNALPLDAQTKDQIKTHREAIRNILAHKSSRLDDRVLVFVGPCSVHSVEGTLHYARLLAKAAHAHRDHLLLVMRVYIEKPRTTVGWKGLVHDPDLTESRTPSSPPPPPPSSETTIHGSTAESSSSSNSSSLASGLTLSRKLMLEVAQLGLAVVTEVLTPLVAPFVDDLLACGVIGARTTESQTHRELVSGLALPVGFKNGTDGSVAVAVDAMVAAAAPHSLLTVNAHGHLVHRRTAGNPSTFLILRGGTAGPNYSADHLRSASTAVAVAVAKAGRGGGGGVGGVDYHPAAAAAAAVPAAVVVDCSHGNSDKDYRNQGRVAAAVAAQIAAGAPVAGVMIESNINEGRQDIGSAPTPGELAYGVSVTDGCVGWHETEAILGLLASAAQERRRLRLGCH